MVQARLTLKQAHPIKSFDWIGLESSFMHCGWVEFKPGIGLVLTVPMSDETAQARLAQAEKAGMIGKAQDVPE